MKRNGEGHYRLALAVVAMVVFVPLVQWVRAQGGKTPVHLTTDWSNRHMIFSQPSNLLQALALSNDARFGHQWLRQNPGILLPKGQGPVSDSLATPVGNPSLEEILQNRGVKGPGGPGGPLGPKTTPEPLRVDWGMPLPAGASVGVGKFPAKFQFNVAATPSCTADYVAFNTSLVGGAATPSIVAFDELYSTQGGGMGPFCGTSGPSVKWAYNTNAGDATGVVSTSPVISGDGTRIAYVETRTHANGGAILELLEWKPGAGATVDGTIAAPATPHNTVTNWNACTSGDSCLISVGFGNTEPDTNSSPFYDYNDDVLYVGDDTGVLHKFINVFNGGATAITEQTTGGWPATITSGDVLTGPVYDSNSKLVFVGDGAGDHIASVTAAGVVAKVTVGAAGNTVVDAPMVDGTNETVFVFAGGANAATVAQFRATPALTVMTTAAGWATPTGSPSLYSGAFDNTYYNAAAGAGTGHLLVCAPISGHGDHPGIFRLSFTIGGGGNAGKSVMNGTPDGGSFTDTSAISLISSSGSGQGCSPITENFNTATSTDAIFVAVGNNGATLDTGTGATCSAANLACIMSLTLTAAWGPPATMTSDVVVPIAAGVQYGTSGIIIDNEASTTSGNFPQASSIYFNWQGAATGTTKCNTTGSGGCAVKLTQAGLN